MDYEMLWRFYARLPRIINTLQKQDEDSAKEENLRGFKDILINNSNDAPWSFTCFEAGQAHYGIMPLFWDTILEYEKSKYPSGRKITQSRPKEILTPKRLAQLIEDILDRKNIPERKRHALIGTVKGIAERIKSEYNRMQKVQDELVDAED